MDVLHNQPDSATAIREDLTEKHAAIIARTHELISASDRVPAVIDGDEIAGKVGDFIKQVSACSKNAETARVAEKEPHLAAGRTVDGWFKSLTDPLDRAKSTIQGRLTIYLREKEAKERTERERIAREEREAAEAAAKLAREAESQMQDVQGLEVALKAQDSAAKAAADAAQATKAAQVIAADLSRTRGDYGSVASLQTFWDFKGLDRDNLDLATLRQHIPLDALEKAVRSFVKAGGRELAGVEIFENTKAAVR